MRTFDETKTYELYDFQIDKEKGYLKPDKKFVMHHDAVEGREAVYQDREVEEEGGGISIYKDLITPAVMPQEAYDEYEDIYVYVKYTEEELKDHKRAERVQLLEAFDKYKSNVDYGIESETEAQHENMISWYENLLDLKEYAFQNIPERIKYYL